VSYFLTFFFILGTALNVEHQNGKDHGSNTSFTQDQPILQNPYCHDGLLKEYLCRHIPEQVHIEFTATFLFVLIV